MPVSHWELVSCSKHRLGTTNVGLINTIVATHHATNASADCSCEGPLVYLMQGSVVDVRACRVAEVFLSDDERERRVSHDQNALGTAKDQTAPAHWQ